VCAAKANLLPPLLVQKIYENFPIKTFRIFFLVCLFALAAGDQQTNGLIAAPALARTGTNSIYAAYGGSASCRECHEEIYDNWAKSHHAHAEREPSPFTENAAFVPAQTFKHGTQQTSLRATNGQYQVITAGLHGTNEIFPVARVLAENPLRQMLIPFPGGRVQVTEAAWDPRSNQWFNVYGNEDRKPGEWGHWLGRGMNWNSMCAACHNTRVRKNYDAATDSYHTTMVEHGVGCESCHGPMSAHNDWQHAHKNSAQKDPTVTKLTRENFFNTCAGCHSRRGELTGDPVPGDNFFEHHLLTIVDDSDIFYPDGQIRDEDYEVTAFMGSQMFHKGVRCMDCHDVHTMKTKLPGNFLCLSCHGPAATNAPAINPVTHSHHLAFGYNTNGVLTNLDLSKYVPARIKETGGECVNCHMPQTPYMVRHWRHDHGFTIPDPLLTKEFKIPNACERCHADKGTDWNLKYVEQWYGTNMNRPYRWHGETIARARLGDENAIQPLLKMLLTDEQFYWRAVAANLLQRWCAEPTVTAPLIAALTDTNALVRQCAATALGPLAQAGRPEILAALQPLLNDPSRNVRIATAQQLGATLDTNSLAGRDYLHSMAHNADQPLGQLQIGLFEFQHGDATNALTHFQTAAAWDPYSPGVHGELATLLSQLGRPDDAVAQLRKAVELAPKDADGHFRLALGLNDTGDAAGATAELEQAVKLDPHHARAAYNLGLARNASGDTAGALEALQAAAAADPHDAQIPYARATILARLGRMDEAGAAVRRALKLNPRFTEASALLQTLSDKSANP
jgi:Flp pilus assembly protein TadD